jgi:hypothetical protein
MSSTGASLEALRDVHLPDAVAFWPPAPGWWLLLAGLVAAALAVLAWRRARRRSLCRAALAVVDSAEGEYRATGDLSDLAASLSAVLRRVSVARFGRRAVASLHGDGWVRQLESGAPGISPEMVGSLERALYAASAPAAAPEAESWIASTRAWIRRVS